MLVGVTEPKSIVTVLVVAAAQGAYTGEYGEAAWTTFTVTSRVARLCVTVKVLAAPLPMLVA